MGITGLLPALKAIQVTKQLKEFSGKTIAVDAYVWLHRGVHTCATELATGKPTHKYVDYAMRHVRLLRHHGIEPYLVFDGGPLPAKKGTENDRKQRRDEARARGDALAAAGKYGQARESYLKSIDVTPQMAYQLIKALRADSVPYIVAPYEADAQLAYLERLGIVDAILTEDSDLLVFGCQNVLFKLDSVANTVVSISRKDFGCVCTSSSEISLFGWSDVQFRTMAILSGCDYLPSIPGIGLKTAYMLLRKHKTAERVVKTIQLQGKRTVPRKYLNDFNLADKCFQHQRVYCPLQEKLVYLTEVDSSWTKEEEAYVGANLDASLAKKLAMGDVCPVSLLPMEDINPSFVPCAKPHSVAKRPDKGKGKGTQKPAKEGILSFFGPNPKIPPRRAQDRPPLSPVWPKKIVVGRDSGKRTLTEVMDRDISVKRKQRSKFFGTSASVSVNMEQGNIAAGPSREDKNKENIFHVISDEDEAEISSNFSIEARGDVDEEMEMDLQDPALVATIAQEDGYMSPTSDCSEEMQDLSSPLRPGTGCTVQSTHRSARRSRSPGFETEVVSSPPPMLKQSDPPFKPMFRTRSLDLPRPPPLLDDEASISQSITPAIVMFSGPDLRHAFGDCHSIDIDCFNDEEGQDGTNSNSSTPPTPTPLTPLAQALPQESVLDLTGSNSRDELHKKAIAIKARAPIIVHTSYLAITASSRLILAQSLGPGGENSRTATPWGRFVEFGIDFDISLNSFDCISLSMKHRTEASRTVAPLIKYNSDHDSKGGSQSAEYSPTFISRHGTHTSSRVLQCDSRSYLSATSYPSTEHDIGQMSYPESSQRTALSEDVKPCVPYADEEHDRGTVNTRLSFPSYDAFRLPSAQEHMLSPPAVANMYHDSRSISMSHQTDLHNSQIFSILPHSSATNFHSPLYLLTRPTLEKTELLDHYESPSQLGSGVRTASDLYANFEADATHDLGTPSPGSSIPMCNMGWSSASTSGTFDQAQAPEPRTTSVIRSLNSAPSACQASKHSEQQNCQPAPSFSSSAIESTKKKKSKMHQCEVCGKLFPRPSGLKTHMNTHNNLKPSSPPYSVGFDTPTIVPPPTATNEMTTTPYKLRWMPPSLSTRTNATSLVSVSDDESSDEEYSLGLGDQYKSVTTLPRFPVAMSSSERHIQGPVEERDSRTETSLYPYQVRSFAGQIFLSNKQLQFFGSALALPAGIA
ncbi:hypothetical protein C0992_007630 [Termitomyces sp. T32_za158]|nr:hypothetical protein C0992_007630 [Termitomyces sp. T32_za158]